MIKLENECVGCEHCIGLGCPNREVARCYCDKCGEEISSDEIYDVDGEDLCEWCLKERFKRR